MKVLTVGDSLMSRDVTMWVHVATCYMLAGVTDIGCSGTDECWNMTFHGVQDLCCYILLLGNDLTAVYVSNKVSFV